MAIFNPKEVSLILNDYVITDWSDGSDVINVKRHQEAGTYHMGLDGRGVFIANTDLSGTLTLKIKMHSADNEFLNDQFRLQNERLKAFIPLTLEIIDLLNGDTITGEYGFFTTPTEYVRGSEHNAHVWTIAFERILMSLEPGFGNTH